MGSSQKGLPSVHYSSILALGDPSGVCGRVVLASQPSVAEGRMSIDRCDEWHKVSEGLQVSDHVQTTTCNSELEWDRFYQAFTTTCVGQNVTETWLCSIVEEELEGDPIDFYCGNVIVHSSSSHSHSHSRSSGNGSGSSTSVDQGTVIVVAVVDIMSHHYKRINSDGNGSVCNG